MPLYMNPFSKFQDLQNKLLVSCPKDPSSSGGLYLIDFSLKHISKILEADCRGIAEYRDGFFLTTNSHGILKLNEHLNIISNYNVSSLDLHGMTFGPNEILYVVETAVNAIGIYQTEPFKRIDEIKISPFSDDQNHINDIYISNDSIFVSMFSLTGGWRNRDGLFDGVISEYDLQSKQLIKIHYDNLQLPHSVVKIDNQIHYCESLNLSLNKENEPVASLGGYTRGLDYDGRNFFIGQSEMRYLDRILSVVPNVNIDCGIHILDSIRRTNRFFPLPATQVYEILVLNKKFIQEDIPESVYLNNHSAYKSIVSLNEWHDEEEQHRWMSSSKATLKIKKQQYANFL